jgi:hypothetical protein
MGPTGSFQSRFLLCTTQRHATCALQETQNLDLNQDGAALAPCSDLHIIPPTEAVIIHQDGPPNDRAVRLVSRDRCRLDVCTTAGCFTSAAVPRLEDGLSIDYSFCDFSASPRSSPSQGSSTASTTPPAPSNIYTFGPTFRAEAPTRGATCRSSDDRAGRCMFCDPDKYVVRGGLRAVPLPPPAAALRPDIAWTAGALLLCAAA